VLAMGEGGRRLESRRHQRKLRSPPLAELGGHGGPPHEKFFSGNRKPETINQKPETPMKLLLKVMKALADGNRLRILRLLLDRPRCVCELQRALGITQPSVSKHLRILEEAGLVEKERSGQFIDYRLAPAPDSLDERAALMGHLIPWLRDDPELKAFSLRAAQIDRRSLCSRPGTAEPEAGRILEA